MHLRRLAPVLLMLLVGVDQRAECAPVVFEHWGVGSGSIGGTSFANTEFKVTAVGNTDTRTLDHFPSPDPAQPDLDVYSIDHSSASIEISGIGQFALLSATRTFYSKVALAVGWGREGTQGDIFGGPFSLPASMAWDMTTSLAEISGLGVVVESLGSPAIVTSGGQLNFAGEYGVAAKFRATVVPEPMTIGLVAFAAVRVVSQRRRTSLTANL
jgi:hypothetical protein